MTPKIIVLDVETENTGYDIKEGNKRIISVQLLDGKNAEIYYDSAPSTDLNAAKDRLSSLIQAGNNLAGFNLINFDVPLIEKFLDVKIPAAQIVEISEMTAMEFIRQKLRKDRPKLEEACKCLGIDCTHKEIMNRHANKFKQLPEVIEKAKEGANKLQKERGWDYDICFNVTLNKICGGMAILDAFKDFVKRKGDTKSDFYRYAIGDVEVENKLFLKLKEIEKKNTKT
jgi:hypothetical protein